MSKTLENLYKKSSDESTPQALDNLILHAAKQSCKKEPAKKHKNKKWFYIVPVAAVMVMSFSVVLNLQTENQVMLSLPEARVSPSPVILQEELPKQNYKEREFKEDSVMRPQKPMVKLKKNIKQESLNRLSREAKRESKREAKKPAKLQNSAGLGQIYDYKPINATRHQPDDLPERMNYAAPAPNMNMEAIENASESDSYADEIIVDDNDKNLKDFMGNPETLSGDLAALEKLINSKKTDEAKHFLVRLKKHYPTYDFSDLSKKINAIQMNEQP